MANVEGDCYIVQRDKSGAKSKCRKWELRFPVGLDPRTGKHKTKTSRFNGTYTETKKALREFVDEIQHDRVQGKTSCAFEEYCERFLERRALGKEVAETTQRRQRWQFKAVCRHIGKASRASITPAMLDDMYIAMLKGDTLSGKPSGGGYVNQIHDNITLVFERAKKEGILVKNPCDAANPPKMGAREKRALNPDQAHVFIAMLDEKDDRERAYLLAVTMGLRRGEICGLSWGDIDFERGIVEISHSHDTLGNLKEAKTKAGMRLLPLPENVAEALKEHKGAQKERYDRTSQWRKPCKGHIEQTDESPAISDKCETRLLLSTLSRRWTEDRVKCGLEGWCFHELRHIYLTMPAPSGVHPKVMQELAGHYSSQITMDIYINVNMDAKHDVVAAVSKVFA